MLHEVDVSSMRALCVGNVYRSAVLDLEGDDGRRFLTSHLYGIVTCSRISLRFGKPHLGGQEKPTTTRSTGSTYFLLVPKP